VIGNLRSVHSEHRQQDGLLDPDSYKSLSPSSKSFSISRKPINYNPPTLSPSRTIITTHIYLPLSTGGSPGLLDSLDVPILHEPFLDLHTQLPYLP
jgi:hypothetical protein